MKRGRARLRNLPEDDGLVLYKGRLEQAEVVQARAAANTARPLDEAAIDRIQRQRDRAAFVEVLGEGYLKRW